MTCRESHPFVLCSPKSAAKDSAKRALDDAAPGNQCSSELLRDREGV